MKLMSVAAARARMLARAAPLGIEAAPLAEAFGRTLAADIAAGRDQPPFAASAMDGWAVRAADTPGTLEIAGESAAGHGFAGAVGKGEAVRIFTGAAIPAGADTVVIQEEAERAGQTVSVGAAEAGRHIRPAGQDFRAGDVLLTAGSRLDAWRLALAAAAGGAQISVARRPRVAILATGEEIVEPGAAAGPHQIYNSGSSALSALVASWGGEAASLPIAGDDAKAIALAVAGAGGDLVITIGGASVGDHDLVKPALATLGLALEVESIALRPGKPTWFGVLGDGRMVLGLPGNPASALVTAELFLRPLIAALLGADPVLPIFAAKAGTALPANGPREHWMRARLAHGAGGEIIAHPFADQDSSLITVFAQADALLRRAPGAGVVTAGESVDVLALARL
ncbi:MAG TPA: gephyrin-like molybdotransferase Glp [Caulobacteraceae bacterium]|jgi:molybdopterin molybdotransferase|nr:gephyrin-like molybdotransferase Glp [Caulobacteraceae bacterium]